MKKFTGRIIAPGTVTAEAVVSHSGFNTLASLYHNPKPCYCIALFTWISPSLTCELLEGKEFCLLYNYLYHLRAWNRADVQ